MLRCFVILQELRPYLRLQRLMQVMDARNRAGAITDEETDEEFFFKPVKKIVEMFIGAGAEVVVKARIEGISMSRRVDILETRERDILRSVMRILRPCTQASLD